MDICLVEDWDSSSNDKTRSWYKQVNDVLNLRLTGSSLVERFEKYFPSFDDVREATSKASIVFRSIMAFNLSRGGLDWAGVARSPDGTHEDHHIFPRDWLANNRDQTEDKQLWISLRDSVLNRIFASKEANDTAKALTPPSYLNKLTAYERRTLQIPDSFLGPLETPIKSEAFSAFLRDRYNLIKADLIEFVRHNLLGKEHPAPSIIR